MPRGLGDDPLSRQRKNAASKRSGASTAPFEAPHADDPQSSSSTAQPSVLNIAEAPSSSPASIASSYNDVFWKKRPESASVSLDVPLQDATPNGPAEAPAIAATVELPPMQEQKVEPTAPASLIPEAFTIPESHEPIANQTSPPVEPEAEHHKGGFFSRIFGKIRK